MEWADCCPWCGEPIPTEVTKPSEYDMWLEAHVAECEPYLREQGQPG